MLESVNAGKMDIFKQKIRSLNILNHVLPYGSNRRALIKLVYKFIRHPILMCKQISFYRIKLVALALAPWSRLSLSEVVERYNQKQQIEQELHLQLEEFPNLPLRSDLEGYPSFAIPVRESERPLVSIIIPVHNQFAYTYNCIHSIVDANIDIPYEIIVADDASTDLTQRIGNIISNVCIVRNEESLRFLRNCNKAARQARGEYIVFLNNDTQVCSAWLPSLLELIEHDDTIGLVGSKFVYPDGRLQEAGGVIWNDGTALNYGRGNIPTASEYNYVKDVDYISGASILIRAELWRQLGGFDESFAPAYYEDSDLAFSVRKAGYRVVYQPKSAVIHFEGVSNGTSLANGQKAYQIVNQKKFYTKWKDTLQKENGVPGKDIFRARSRALYKKVLLMIDALIPTFDQDAGSRTVYQYLQLFIDEGYQVIFIGDNFARIDPYTSILQEMGIEVLYGPWYALHWEDWIKRYGKDIDYVWLNRPQIAKKYIRTIRRYSNAKIIYYGMDLHYLREQRRFESLGEQEANKEVKSLRKLEYNVLRSVDVAYYLSQVEIDEIHRNDPSLIVRKLCINIFKDQTPCEYTMHSRSDLIFVGGFRHLPNQDAVRWLAEELMPNIWKVVPNIHIHIVGSNVTDEIENYANDRFIIDGYLSDEQLITLYQQCEIAFIPLRYGAGVKGKVIEAMRNGLPVLTTQIGAEGIDGAEDILQQGDTTEELVAKVLDLYNNESRLCALSKLGIEYVQKHFSFAAAKEVLSNDFTFVQ